MGDQDNFGSAVFRRPQHIQHVPGAARVGEKEDHVLLVAEGRRHGLHVGVLDVQELGGGGGEAGPGLHSHHVAAALAETEYPPGVGEQVHGFCRALRIHQLQRLAHGRHIRLVELAADIFKTVPVGHGGSGVRRVPGDRGVVHPG